MYGASGVLGMASVDSEQDTITWQVRTHGILTFYLKTSLIWNRNIYSFWKAFRRLGGCLAKDSCTLVQTDVLSEYILRKV